MVFAMLRPSLVGIDVGSMMVKLVATEGDGEIAYGRYEGEAA